MSEYEIHVPRTSFEALWDDEDDTEHFPFGEDVEEIDRIIEEEIGSRPSKPRRRRLR